MFSTDKNELLENDNVGYIKKYTFIGTVIENKSKYGGPVIGIRNQLNRDNELDILQPGKNPQKHRINKIIMASNGEEVDVANPNDMVVIPGLFNLNPYSILRIKK